MRSTLQIFKLFAEIAGTREKSRAQCCTKTFSACAVCLQSDHSDISDWQCCIAVHLRECSLICTLSQTTAVTDLESQMRNLDYKATWRTEEKEEDSGVTGKRKRGGGLLRQAGTWRNVLSGSCSALFVSLCNVCGKEKGPGNQSSWWSTWWYP